MSNNNERPAKRVRFSPSDTMNITPQGGGSAKFFKEITSEFKDSLVFQIENSLLNLNQSSLNVGIMVVELESQALAKSHRPDAIFNENTCPFIGDIGISPNTKQGRFIVRSTAEGLLEIRNKIRTSDAEYFQKALSTICGFDTFTPDINYEKLSNENNFIVRLFDFQDENFNRLKLRKYNELILQNSFESREIVPGCGIFYLNSNGNDRVFDFFNILKDENILLSVESTNLINFRPLQLLSNGVNFDLPSAVEDKNYPVVGIVDTCIKGDCPAISSWYEGEITSIIDEEKVFDHGTFVAGLVSNAYHLNTYDDNFPRSQSKVFSVGVLSSNGASMHDIHDMLTRAQRRRPDIKIWNLSLGAETPVELDKISDFAVMLDTFQKENNCICIIAAGNINNVGDLRKWPPLANEPKNEQRISAPGDSVLGVTVASIAQIDGIVNKFEPSIFSRSGPVANYILKPDLCHYGGNHLENGNSLVNLGVTSLGIASDTHCTFGQDCGTSFSTPLVSTIAANLWQFMGYDTPRHTIKGLLAHSARLRQEIDKHEKVYYGWGMPFDVNNFMFCNENEITMVLEGEISSNSEIVGKLPFPIPDSLRTDSNKVKAEFFMTVSYDPPLDSNRAFEYCLVNIDAGLGEIEGNSFKGKVPAEGTGFEQDLVNGKYKWSPVKVYHKKYTRGVDVENWKLQVKMLTRHGFEPPEDFVQPFSIILTIRALDPDAQVYNEMVRLMDQYNWEVSNANISIEQQVQV